MEDLDGMSNAFGSKIVIIKRETPNKRRKAEHDDFLIPRFVEQARKWLKCDKSYKRSPFAYAAVPVNTKFKIDFSPKNIENHYRTFKVHYDEIKKVKELCNWSSDEATKTISLDPFVALAYIEVFL